MGRPTAVRRAGEVKAWSRSADVVVAGFGSAGACAAVEARAAGAEVLVLERAGGGGGTSANSTGQIFLGGGTLTQKANTPTDETALWSVFTMGGLRASPEGQVLSPDGEAVAGLYAAGRTTSGLAAQGYSSGLSIADATFFGRRAGRSAAQCEDTTR